MTTKTHGTVGPEAGQQGWLLPAPACPAATPAGLCPPVLWAHLSGQTALELPRRVLALAGTSGHCRAACTDQHRRADGPRRAGCRWRVCSHPTWPSIQVSFCSERLVPQCDACSQQCLLLCAVTYVAPRVLFAKEPLVCPRTEQRRPCRHPSQSSTGKSSAKKLLAALSG